MCFLYGNVLTICIVSAACFSFTYDYKEHCCLPAAFLCALQILVGVFARSRHPVGIHPSGFERRLSLLCIQTSYTHMDPPPPPNSVRDHVLTTFVDLFLGQQLQEHFDGSSG